jgi:sensor histidine kinase YesM
MACPRLRRAGWLAPAVILVMGLTALEWWSAQKNGLGIGAPGVFTGVAAAALLLVAITALDRLSLEWSPYLTATVRAVFELIVGAALATALASVTELMLPVPVLRRLFATAAIDDLIVFTFILLAVFVSARSWQRHAQQKVRTMEAQVRESKARIALEEQKSHTLQARIQAAEARADAEQARSSALRSQIDAAEAHAALMEKGKDLAHYQLRLLRKQIEPHFFFNTLGSVQYLVQKDPASAARMLTHLIRYLRATLMQMNGEASSLGSEFESARAYLEIMKERMGERLTVSVEIPDELRAIAFEPLLVQTLVENAVKHGIEPKVGPVSISLKAHVREGDNAQLIVEVTDNGVGLQSKPATGGTGLGLDNIRKRIRALFGEEGRLSIQAAPGGGVVARIEVPFAQQEVQ